MCVCVCTVFMYICMFVFIYVCMYVCIYVCMYVCMYVCVCLCRSVMTLSFLTFLSTVKTVLKYCKWSNRLDSLVLITSGVPSTHTIFHFNLISLYL